jgi:hypothetical protein
MRLAVSRQSYELAFTVAYRLRTVETMTEQLNVSFGDELKVGVVVHNV